MLDNTKIEDVVINQLLWNPKFFSKVVPFIKADYYEDPILKIIIKHILAYYIDHDSQIPDINVLKVLVEGDANLSESLYNEVQEYIQLNCSKRIETDYEWLYESTEKFCLDRSVYNAIIESVNIYEGNVKNVTKDVLPDLLAEALSVSFDTDVGHDYIENASERYDFVNQHNAKYPCSLDAVNLITKGGFEKKTLNVFIGSVGAGKSILLAQLAKDYIEDGKNVLFITLEMSAQKIATRIDSNAMNINVNHIPGMDKSIFLGKIDRIKQKSMGRLVIKEYTPGSAHVGHLDVLMKELKGKKGFVPDVILVDYIGIMASKSVTPQVGLYSYGKAITEELRAFMIKHDAVGFSVVQFNRGAAFSSDANHSGIADSAAIIHTVDFLAGLLVTPELKESGLVLLLQMKNRYGPDDVYIKQKLGLDTSFMRYYDVSQDDGKSASDYSVDPDLDPSEDDVPLFDKSTNSATLNNHLVKKKGKGNYKNISC